MNRFRNILRRPRPQSRRRADQGSVLTITLILVIVGGMVIGGLLTFTAGVIRARPPLEERTRGTESAKSAMRLAIMLQVSKGPNGCIAPGTDFDGATTFDMNGFQGTVTCTPLAYYDTGRNRYGIITTQMNPTQPGLAGFNGSTSGSAYLKEVDGDVFIAGGELITQTSDILIAGTSSNPFNLDYSNSVATAPGVTPAVAPPTARYRLGGGASIDCDTAVAANTDGYPSLPSQTGGSSDPFLHVHTPCSAGPPVAWWERAGDDYNAEDNIGTWQYPRLPQLPSFDRDGKFVDLTATCRMYYPGRYDDALTLSSARDHFFASGIYYFRNTLTVQAGAKVVFGEGRQGGCAVDSDLALNPASLSQHSITGKGATILLDNAGRITIQNANFFVNRRVSTPGTRGSEGMAIRTVNFGTSTAMLQVPRDRVQQGEYPCMTTAPGVCAIPFVPDANNNANTVDVGAHQVMVPATPNPVALTYTGSTLTQTNDAVLVDFTGATSQSQARFEVEGYIFTPNARFNFRGPTTAGSTRQYRFVTKTGIVASQVFLNTPELPATPMSNWFVGVEAQPVKLRVGLVARVTSPTGRTSTSRAVVEVKSNTSYAVNSWTADPDQMNPTPTVPVSTVPTTTIPVTTTTLPATTTTAVGPTTSTTPTTTTTLPPTTTTVPAGTCPTITGWQGQYWNNMNLSGAASLCRNDAAVNFDWGTGGPGSPIGSNNFSARWTRTQHFAAGTYRFTAGGDDGYRLWVNGVLVIDEWNDHAYQTDNENVTLPGGNVTIRYEWYENGGAARATLTWVKL
jgi:hypothetical protein